MIGNIGSVFDGRIDCITFLGLQASRTRMGGGQKVMFRSQHIRDDHSAWMVSRISAVQLIDCTHLSAPCDGRLACSYVSFASNDVPSRIPVARSCIESPRRSFANRVVATASVFVRISCTSMLMSIAWSLASASLCLRSAFLVKPSPISQEHSRPRSRQNSHTGRWPEHFVFLF